MKKISIITPVYNEEDNIIDCANSVKKFFDLYKDDYDYEHIFVDNSSTDSTILILKNKSVTPQNYTAFLHLC